MEHIIIKDLNNGYFRLRPEKGYKLFSLDMNGYVSEAVVKEEKFNRFRAEIV